MKLENIIYEKEGEELAVIKLNRPKVNAVIPALYEDFLTALEAAKDDPKVRVVIIEGEGRCFSAGADIKAVPRLYDSTEQQKQVHSKVIQGIARAFFALDKPTIAACHGYALGGGLEIALLADIIIAAEGCKFGFPEASVGAVVSKGATRILPLLVGLLKAKELLLTAEIIDAAEAEKIGLVNKVVPLSEMHNTAIEMEKKIVKNYPLAVKGMKAALDRGTESTLEAALELESYLSVAVQSERIAGMKKRAEQIGKEEG